MKKTIGFNLASRDALEGSKAGDVFINAVSGIEYKYSEKGVWEVEGKKAVTFTPDKPKAPKVEPTEYVPKVSAGDVLHDSESGKDYVKQGGKWVEKVEEPAEKPAPKKRTTKKAVKEAK